MFGGFPDPKRIGLALVHDLDIPIIEAVNPIATKPETMAP